MGKTKREREANEANNAAAQIQADAAQRIAEIQAGASDNAAQLGLQGTQLAVAGSTAAAGLIAGATSTAARLGLQAQQESLALQREQYDESVERLAPFAEAGLEALPELEAAGTLGGMEARLAAIQDTNAFADLRAESQRHATNTVAQSGGRRSGAALRAATEISASSALTLDDRLYGRQANLVAIGESAAAGQNYAGANFANQSSSINTNTAASVGNLLVNGAGQQANFINQAGQFAQQGAIQQGQYGQQAAFFQGQGIGGVANARAGALVNNANNSLQSGQNRTNNYLTAAATIASFFASDTRLKENILPLGKIHDLTLVEWDWKPEAKNMMGTEMSTGFIAQEVEAKYPDMVTEINGIKVINYPALQKTLKERLAA